MHPNHLAVFATALVGLAASIAAQCPLTWTPSPQQELTGVVTCSLVWDSDGSGPLPTRLFVGGTGLAGGDLPTGNRIMAWDGTNWSRLGTTAGPGTGGSVEQMLLFNGELIAAGSFTGSGHTRIARWDGAAWQPLGNGFPAGFGAMAVFSASSLVVSGSSLSPHVESWDGTAWTQLPPPPLLEQVVTAASFRGEVLFAGSRLSGTVGVLERWNGSSWGASITAQAPIRQIAVLGSLLIGGTPTLYVGGDFTSISGTSANRIASTAGGVSFAWSDAGNGFNGPCLALHARPVGTGRRLVAQDGSSVPRTWTGSGVWTPMGSGNLRALAYYSGSYHALSANASSAVAAVRRFDGTDWAPVRGPGISIANEVSALTRSGADMIVSGSFHAIAGVTLNGVARWNGDTFTPLGAGLIGGLGSVYSLLTTANGDVIAGGDFTGGSGGPPLANIARWNGSAWSALGTGLAAEVRALAQMPNGDVIAGGNFQSAGGVPANFVARWNGTTWAPLGTGFNNAVLALAVRSDGTLFAGGLFTMAGGVPCDRIAKWDGTTWSPLGAGCNNNVNALAVRPNGDLVALGLFATAGGIPVDRCARWNGTTWASMGALSGDLAPPSSLCVLANGDVIASRGFHPPFPSVDEGLSRWNETTFAWSSLGGGLASGVNGNSVRVMAMAQRADGALVVGGSFASAGGRTSRSLASLRSSCMPTAQPFGAGCNSTAGPLVLTADTLPWLGAICRATTTGVAANSLCLRAIGFATTSLALAALVPQGRPGCLLLVSPDLVDLLPPAPGIASSQFLVPSTAALLGTVLHQQTVPCEFGAGGALVAIRSSNALTLTIGTL